MRLETRDGRAHTPAHRHFSEAGGHMRRESRHGYGEQAASGVAAEHVNAGRIKNVILLERDFDYKRW